MTQNIQIIHVSHTDTSTSQSRDHVIMSELEIAISHGTHIHVALLSTPQPIIPRRSLSREKKQKKKKKMISTRPPPPLLPPDVRSLCCLLSNCLLPLSSPLSYFDSRVPLSFSFLFGLVWFGSSLLLRDSDCDARPTQRMPCAVTCSQPRA